MINFKKVKRKTATSTLLKIPACKTYFKPRFYFSRIPLPKEDIKTHFSSFKKGWGVELRVLVDFILQQFPSMPIQLTLIINYIRSATNFKAIKCIHFYPPPLHYVKWSVILALSITSRRRRPTYPFLKNKKRPWFSEKCPDCAHPKIPGCMPQVTKVQTKVQSKER